MKIHYETWGEGYPIILVHGIIANLKLNWLVQNWVETLRPIRRVVALDCRGHGESDKPHDPAAYGSENTGQDVLRLMDYLGIDKAEIVNANNTHRYMVMRFNKAHILRNLLEIYLDGNNKEF